MILSVGKELHWLDDGGLTFVESLCFSHDYHLLKSDIGRSLLI